MVLKSQKNYGINLKGNSNTIQSNKITGNSIQKGYGIYIYKSKNNILKKNSITKHKYGLNILKQSQKNKIISNKIGKKLLWVNS
ncbi:NosD domain-containing protein [Methanobrevibacter arboriphilus]|uniref:NosD domain-containing protein n=1 Tax=Methanobrevibacter arboriphilus TaxID=39441 RepID=UPI001CDB34B1